MSYDLSQHYGLFLKRFTKQVADVTGPQPGLDCLKVAFAFSQRSQKQAVALAMCLRPEGATGPEIQYVCGAPQNNWRKGLIEAGYFKRVAVPSRNGVTVYKLEVSKRGEAMVAKAVTKADADAAKADATDTAEKPAKVAKPAKGAGKAKGKAKAKAARVVAEPTSEPTSEPDKPVAVPLADDGATVDAVVTDTALQAAE